MSRKNERGKNYPPPPRQSRVKIPTGAHMATCPCSSTHSGRPVSGTPPAESGAEQRRPPDSPPAVPRALSAPPLPSEPSRSARHPHTDRREPPAATPAPSGGPSRLTSAGRMGKLSGQERNACRQCASTDFNLFTFTKHRKIAQQNINRIK